MIEPHLLDEDDFLREVQSFSFWFETVEGYLSERPHGRDPDLLEPPLTDVQRQTLVTILCNYCVGEAAALEASSSLVRLAPNHNARIFMATQAVDEARHLGGRPGAEGGSTFDAVARKAFLRIALGHLGQVADDFAVVNDRQAPFDRQGAR